MFRLTVTLKEEIDKDILNIALKNVMKRFPTYNYRLREGIFWFYFDKLDGYPEVQDDYNNPLLRIIFRKNNYYLFRVRTYKNRLAVEIFHSLTDGNGGLTFLLTLTGEYLRLKYNIKIDYNDRVLNPKDEPTKEEFEDSFKHFNGTGGALEKDKKAYHMKGIKEPVHILNIVTGKMRIDEVKRVAKKYDATITEFLTGVMIEALDEIGRKKNNKKPIKVSIPINLRTIYGYKTLRNFSSYINVGIIPKKKKTPLEEIIKDVHNQMKDLMKREKIDVKVTANVELAKNFFIRRVPIIIKKKVMGIIGNKKGDKLITTTFSNLGLIKVPEEMSEYITDLNFILGRSKGTSGSVTGIGYKDNLYITFSRKIKEAEFERLFFTKLVKMGIEVEVESNR
jgi:NRPS condensation-like uncharacterized protein